MKESYSEGIANHTGSESCVGDPRGRGEALTGVRTGWVLNRETIIASEGADSRSGGWKATSGRSQVNARAARTPRGRRPQARTETPCTGIGRSHEWPGGPSMLPGTIEMNRDLQLTSEKTRDRGRPAHASRPECAHCLARSTGTKTGNHRDVR